MPKFEAAAQPNQCKKRKKNKKLRRKRNHKKTKTKENKEEENESNDSSHEEDDESDTILEVTEDRSVHQNIDDWSEKMLTTAENQQKSTNEVSYKTGTQVDQLFPGGIKCREIIELCGQHQCGKTKMATSIAISLLLNYKEKQAIYMYSNNDFHVSNVRRIVLSRGLQEEVVKEVLSRMRLIPIDETDDLIGALKEISDPQKIETYSFVFIDSITVPFYHAKTVDVDINSEMISKVQEYLFNLAKIHDKTVSNLKASQKCNFEFIYSRFSSQTWR
jgi:archaellum biogenesis ATPase FlaH